MSCLYFNLFLIAILKYMRGSHATARKKRNLVFFPLKITTRSVQQFSNRTIDLPLLFLHLLPRHRHATIAFCKRKKKAIPSLCVFSKLNSLSIVKPSTHRVVFSYIMFRNCSGIATCFSVVGHQAYQKLNTKSLEYFSN